MAGMRKASGSADRWRGSRGLPKWPDRKGRCPKAKAWNCCCCPRTESTASALPPALQQLHQDQAFNIHEAQLRVRIPRERVDLQQQHYIQGAFWIFSPHHHCINIENIQIIIQEWFAWLKLLLAYTKSATLNKCDIWKEIAILSVQTPPCNRLTDTCRVERSRSLMKLYPGMTP